MNSLSELKEMLDERIPVFCCIGTMKNTLDSVAPRIGTILEKLGYIVIGTEDYQLHGLNLKERYESEISILDKSKCQIIVIDAAYMLYTDEDFIAVKHSTSPGSGIGHKHLPVFGDVLVACNTFKYAASKGSKKFSVFEIMLLNNSDKSVMREMQEMAVRFVKELSNILKEDGINAI